MKKSFSSHWKASKQPRKQRKYLSNAPLHLMHRFLSTPLSKNLRKQYGKRNIPIKKGDEVLVMQGKFKKKRAKVSSVDRKNRRVTLENTQRTKKDGSKVNVYFRAHALQIQELNLEDKQRIRVLERKQTPEEKKHASHTS